MRNGRSRSSTVVDFGTNRKGVCDFLLVINSNLGPFLRYSDILSENCEFFATPASPNAIARANPVEFPDELFIAKPRILGLSVGEDFAILACVVLTQCQRVTDRQTDGLTDNSTVANTGLCIASFADAL